MLLCAGVPLAGQLVEAVGASPSGMLDLESCDITILSITTYCMMFMIKGLCVLASLQKIIERLTKRNMTNTIRDFS